MRLTIALLALAGLAACGDTAPPQSQLPPAVQACVDAFSPAETPADESDPISLEERAARVEDACTCFVETTPADDIAFITPVFALEQQRLAPDERTRRVTAYLATKGANAEERLTEVRARLNSQCPFREAYPPEDQDASGAILEQSEPDAAPPAP